MSDSCTGACCAVFYLPNTLRDFKRKAESVEDGPYIADMIVPLTVEEARARAAKFGGSTHILKRSAGHHFTCRHWDEETRLCGAYEERPNMCREYPYEESCALSAVCSFVLDPEALETRRARLAAKGRSE